MSGEKQPEQKVEEDTNPWPWCGSCSRENGPICAWARWWRLFPMFFLKTLAREAAQQLASEQSLKWEPLQLGSSQLEMIEDIPLLVLLGRLAGIGLRRPFATAPPHPQHGKTICSVFLLFARLLRITLFLTMFIIMVVSQNSSRNEFIIMADYQNGGCKFFGAFGPVYHNVGLWLYFHFWTDSLDGDAMWGLYLPLFWSRISIKAQQRNFRNLNVEITKSTIWKKTEAATLRPHRHSTHLGTTHSPCTFRAQSPENSAHIAIKTVPFKFRKFRLLLLCFPWDSKLFSNFFIWSIWKRDFFSLKNYRSFPSF